MHKIEEVLRTARRLCRERGGWTFTCEEVVRALPHLNERSVRTHIVSRCCVNAPTNHPHKWPYFRRLQRGRYEILRDYRTEKPSDKVRQTRVAEQAVEYGIPRRPSSVRDVIHAVFHRDEGAYVAQCLEVAVVTEGKTIYELISNLQEAISLHLEGENPESLGISAAPRIVITYEIVLASDATGT